MKKALFQVLIAPDSFKESLTAPEAAEAMATGWKRGFGPCECHCVPLADGGEGTAAVMVAAAGGETVSVEVTGPLGETVLASYGLIDGGKTAVIELAAASGLALVQQEARDLLRATTFGTGELIRHALLQGCRRFIVALGGSATNDGGAGIAQALGVQLLDRQGRELSRGGGALSELDRIECTTLMPEIAQASFTIACDVVNPLCGPNGATYVYGPQKGGDEAILPALDQALCHFGKKLEELSGRPLLELPGIGAAGGAAAPLVAFAQASITPGFQVVAQAVGLEDWVQKADLVLTGEGAIDRQSAQGKVLSGLVSLASHYETPVIAFAGARREGYEELFDSGLTAAFSMAPGPCDVESLVAGARQALEIEVLNTARCYWSARGCS